MQRLKRKLRRMLERWPYQRRDTGVRITLAALAQQQQELGSACADELQARHVAMERLKAEHTKALETERERVDMVLGQFIGMRILRCERGYQFTIHMDPEPYAHFGRMDTRFWEYVSDRMSHEIRRHMATLDFSRVKEMHHPEAYQFDRLRTGVFHKDTRFP